MPGVVKIGFTQQSTLASRLRQLDNTSAPLPFECFYAAHVPDCRKLERTLHAVFDDKRISPRREFFRTTPDPVKLIIELVALREERISDSQQAITPEQREEIESAKDARADKLTFERLGLPVGTTLAFAKDPTVTCTVASPSRVLFRGEEQSPSKAALTVLHEHGFNWKTVSGFEYWTYEGVRLSALDSHS